MYLRRISYCFSKKITFFFKNKDNSVKKVEAEIG